MKSFSKWYSDHSHHHRNIVWLWSTSTSLSFYNNVDVKNFWKRKISFFIIPFLLFAIWILHFWIFSSMILALRFERNRKKKFSANSQTEELSLNHSRNRQSRILFSVSRSIDRSKRSVSLCIYSNFFPFLK